MFDRHFETIWVLSGEEGWVWVGWDKVNILLLQTVYNPDWNSGRQDQIKIYYEPSPPAKNNPQLYNRPERFQSASDSAVVGCRFHTCGDWVHNTSIIVTPS